MAMTLSPGKGTRADINLTPLIDVLLVLLIIFMVTAPTRSVGLGAAVPEERSDEPQSSRPDPAVVVQISKDLTVSINSEPTDFDRLGGRLEEIFKRRAEKWVFVKAAPELEFYQVAKAMDIAKGAGIDRIGLL